MIMYKVVDPEDEEQKSVEISSDVKYLERAYFYEISRGDLLIVEDEIKIASEF